MRKISYFVYKNDLYPIIHTTNGLQYRLDILRAGEVNTISFSENATYRGKNVLCSIIYGKTGRVRYSYGNRFILDKLLERYTSDEKSDFLIQQIVTPFKLEDSSLTEINTFNNKSAVSRITSLVYLEPVDEILIPKTVYSYSSVKIKDLAYFIETKDLKLETKDYKCIKTYDGLHSYIDSVDWSKVKYTAKDTETTGLKFHYNAKNPDKIVGMSHSYKDKQGVYIVFRHKGEEYLDPVKTFEIMKPVMSTKQVWQNGPFDDRVFRTYGIKERIDFELTDILQLTNPDKSALKALKVNARLLLGEDTIELDEILGPNFDANLVEYIPLELITVYACADTDYTLRVFKILYERLDLANKILSEKNAENIRIIAAADWFGFPSDKEYLSKLIEDTKLDKKKMEDFILSYIYKEFSLTSAKELLISAGASKEQLTEDNINKVLQNEEFKERMDRAFIGTRKPYLELEYAEDKLKILYSILKYPKLRMTESGKSLSTGKDYFTDLLRYVEPVAVDRMKDNLYSVSSSTGNEEDILIDKDAVNTLVFPVAHMMMMYAIVETKLSNYTRIMESYEDGRSYIQYRTAVTTTGRITSGIQTLPGYAKSVIGHKQDSEYGMIVFDFDQIELRAAHNEAISMWEHMKTLDGVKNNHNSIINTYDYQPLVEVFNNYESDVHTEMASRFTKLKIRDISTYTRKKYKETTFAGLYGGSSATMARKELTKAKNQAERVEIIKTYDQTKATWLSTDLHLLNYFQISQAMALKPIPSEQIPFNMVAERVGMSIARSGRRRYYNLDNKVGWELRSISNQGRNQPIQGGCFDIYFTAIRNLERGLREAGISEDVARSLIFVHDEDGLEYLKTQVNPLWLCAMIFKHCCIKVDDLPINYYCTPAVVCNWAQGKSDKYEIPKGMLAKLSTDLKDYEILDTLAHDDYVLSKINEYYCDEMEKEMRSHLIGNHVELTSVSIDSRFKFFKNCYMYTKGKTSISKIKEYNVIVNILSQIKGRIEFEVTIDGVVIPKDKWVNVETEVLENVDEFEDFDLDTFMDDVEKVESILSTTDILKSVLNVKTLEELNRSNINVDNLVPDYVPTNIICEEFADKIMILLNKNNDGIIKKKQFDKIDGLLRQMDAPLGRKLFYFIDSDVIDTGVTLPYSFKVEKFDKFITSLRAI